MERPVTVAAELRMMLHVPALVTNEEIIAVIPVAIPAKASRWKT